MSSDRPLEDSGRQDYANQMLRLSRSTSMDNNDRKFHPTKQQHHQQHQHQQHQHQQQHHHQQHQQHHHHHHHQPQQQPYGYPPPLYPRQQPRPHQTRPHRLQTVVTSSFSVEDEREDVNGQRYHRRHMENHEREGVDEREAVARPTSYGRDGPPMFDVRAPQDVKHAKPVRIPPSPPDSDLNNNSNQSPDSLKRSFWHHARPGDAATPQTHPAFLPPKRAKTSRKEKEVVITPRTPGEYDYTRANSWSGPEEDQYRHYRQTYSFPSPWPQRGSFGGYPDGRRDPPPGMEEHYGRAPYDESFGSRGGAFRPMPNSGRHSGVAAYPPIAPQQSFPPLPHQWPQGSYDWTIASGSRDWTRDDYETRDLLRNRTYSREMSWDEREAEARRHAAFEYGGAYGYGEKARHDMMQTQNDDRMDIHKTTHEELRLLAQPDDRISLSETLCTIRENIEVFQATKADVEAPAPGRKHPVVVGQVGLRCIHCRHTTKSSDRVKRAVCYPSSIKRIYRTVIDMKLDHFQHCRFVPKALKDRLDELKAINTRSTGTTMQYFVRAAKKMGMVDATTGSGVRLEEKMGEGSAGSPSTLPNNNDNNDNSGGAGGGGGGGPKSHNQSRQSSSGGGSSSTKKTQDSDKTTKGGNSGLQRSQSDASEGSAMSKSPDGTGTDEPPHVYMGKTVLALPEDKMALSPLRCFLRENVFAFTATEEDIAVRTPTTFSVVVGQVGIGCIHCHRLPAKERSNRAVCFPFSINRIYQSVADIQRFHLGECKMVPPDVRKKFLELQNASSKGSKGLATRQYWVTSAKKTGLLDTPKGIRFCRDPSVPTTQAVSLDILAQVASNVTTVNRPLVLPEDKSNIAEFLYVVMEQLQPCRFTEADRNKRRLKDVGCIGVECKHCAGQVESRKFFWSSVNAVESNFVSVHTHMMECKMVPAPLKEKLSDLKKLRKEQTSRLKTGSQKNFFQRVWKRLHSEKPQQQSESESEAIESQMTDVVEATISSPKQMLSAMDTEVHEAAEKMDVVSV